MGCTCAGAAHCRVRRKPVPCMSRRCLIQPLLEARPVSSHCGEQLQVGHLGNRYPLDLHTLHRHWRADTPHGPASRTRTPRSYAHGPVTSQYEPTTSISAGVMFALLVCLAKRTLNRALAIGNRTARNTPCTTLGTPSRAMLHDDMRHLAGFLITTGKQHTGCTIGTPMLTPACTIHPTVTRLMHILLRRQCLDRRQRLRELFITRHVPQVGPDRCRVPARAHGRVADSNQ